MNIVITIIVIFFIGYIFYKFMTTRIGKHSTWYADKQMVVQPVGGYQGRSASILFRDKSSHFYFNSNHDKLKIDHIYWNGFNQSTIQVSPTKQVTKSKNVIGRTLVGGAIAGIGGAALGGLTSKKVTTEQPALTQTTRYPKNVFLVFSIIKTGEQVTTEISIDGITGDGTKKLKRLESFLGKQHESY